MKIVLAGGTGFLGGLLAASFLSKGYEVVILGRRPNFVASARYVPWSGFCLGKWAEEIDGADVVINLAGKNVKCRYTDKNLKEIRDSRVLSTKVIGEAVKQAVQPPSLWIQMSSAAIYAHSLTEPHNEETGKIGLNEPHPVWIKIVQLVQDWEQALYSSETADTRKTVIRSGVVMGLNPGGAFDIFSKLARLGLGGSVAGGRQMISWIHQWDFVEAIHFLIEKKEICGPVNLCSPYPVSQGEFMKILRKNLGVKLALPAPAWAVKLSAYIIGVDSELSLKSRYALPQVLLNHQFLFKYPKWDQAVKELQGLN